jgi:hypothetical protein
VGNTQIEQAVIDTSTPTVYHINYVATDQAGNTATSTRTVIVEALFSPTLPEVTATSTLDAADQCFCSCARLQLERSPPSSDNPYPDFRNAQIEWAPPET